MKPTHLLPLLASLQMLPWLVSPAAPLPAPQLTVSPQHPVYISGEAMTLTCWAAGASAMSGIQFFWNSKEIVSEELPSPRYNYTHSMELPRVTGEQRGAYSCAYWSTESKQKIESERSQPISITVTARPSAPDLTVSPPHRIFLRGESVTLTCSAPSTTTVSGIRFFRDGQRISFGELQQSEYKARSLQLLSVSQSNAGVYSCESWRTESGREIPSERSQTITIAVTVQPTAPELTVSPPHRVFLRGESVTLTCSAPSTAAVSGIRFFRDGQRIDSGELQGLQDNARSLKLSELHAGAYSCEFLEGDALQEIPSKRSQSISIAVTEPPPQPELSVDPPSGVVSEGFPLNITCTPPGDTREWRFHFYKDGVELVPGDLGSEISTMESGTSSVNVSVLSIPRAGSNITGDFACGYEENVAGRWIPSPRSRAGNVTGNVMVSETSSQRLCDILLGTGGVLLLIAALAALLCYCRRKKRVPKTPKSTEGSDLGERTRNLDPGHDGKGSKATGFGVEQAKQGSEAAYSLLVLPTSQAHTTQSKNKAKPVEDEDVLYSEMVITRTWKAAT